MRTLIYVRSRFLASETSFYDFLSPVCYCQDMISLVILIFDTEKDCKRGCDNLCQLSSVCISHFAISSSSSSPRGSFR